MGLTKEQRVNAAIEFLEANGYKVVKDYSKLIGKWVAFYQEGMTPILHGKVISVTEHGICRVKCKNGCYRYKNINGIIEFCDSKEWCYKIKNPFS